MENTRKILQKKFSTFKTPHYHQQTKAVELSKGMLHFVTEKKNLTKTTFQMLLSKKPPSLLSYTKNFTDVYFSIIYMMEHIHFQEIRDIRTVFVQQKFQHCMETSRHHTEEYLGEHTG